jgi:hypothetical protein
MQATSLAPDFPGFGNGKLKSQLMVFGRENVNEIGQVAAAAAVLVAISPDPTTLISGVFLPVKDAL